MPITRSGYADNRAARRAQYDSPTHRNMRAAIAATVNVGLEMCARCGNQIKRGDKWDLDHADDRLGYLGASHASCNRSAGARHGGAGGASKNLSGGDSPPHLAAKLTL